MRYTLRLGGLYRAICLQGPSCLYYLYYSSNAKPYDQRTHLYQKLFSSIIGHRKHNFLQLLLLLIFVNPMGENNISFNCFINYEWGSTLLNMYKNWFFNWCIISYFILRLIVFLPYIFQINFSSLKKKVILLQSRRDTYVFPSQKHRKQIFSGDHVRSLCSKQRALINFRVVSIPASVCM